MESFHCIYLTFDQRNRFFSVQFWDFVSGILLQCHCRYFIIALQWASERKRSKFVARLMKMDGLVFVSQVTGWLRNQLYPPRRLRL